MQLSNIYKKHFNLNDATFEFIEHDDATVATVYKVTLSIDTHYILKVSSHSRHYFREKYFLELLQDTSFVPEIIDMIEPQTNLYGAILMEYVPGELLKPTDYTDSLVYEIGSILARIHSHKILGYGDVYKSEDFVSDAITYFSQEFEEGFAECKDHLPQKLLERVYEYYKNHSDHLNDVDGACIVHNDFRPGNILIHQDSSVSVIDWASSRAGFAQEDFYYVENGQWGLSLALKNTFLAGYQSIRPVPDYSKIMLLLRLSKSLNIIGFTLKNNRWKGDLSALYTRNRVLLETLLRDH